MDPEDVQEITEGVAKAVEGNENLLYIIVGLMIAIVPRLYKMLQKRLSKQIDEKVHAIAEEVAKPFTELTVLIQEQHKDSMDAQKMFMKEMVGMHERMDKHEERIEKLEP